MRSAKGSMRAACRGSALAGRECAQRSAGKVLLGYMPEGRQRTLYDFPKRGWQWRCVECRGGALLLGYASLDYLQLLPDSGLVTLAYEFKNTGRRSRLKPVWLVSAKRRRLLRSFLTMEDAEDYVHAVTRNTRRNGK